jgi:CBS domain containing-hemolysin-like protein
LHFTRIPVYERWFANVVGSVNIYDALTQADQFTDLNNLIKPIRNLSEDVTVLDAIRIMQNENQKMVLVTRSARLGKDKPVGIVTMKDLVEELIGELTEW